MGRGGSNKSWTLDHRVGPDEILVDLQTDARPIRCADTSVGANLVGASDDGTIAKRIVALAEFEVATVLDRRENVNAGHEVEAGSPPCG